MKKKEMIKNIYFYCKWGLYNIENGLNDLGYEGFTKERVNIELAYVYKAIINMIENGAKCQPSKEFIKEVEEWYEEKRNVKWIL